MNYYTSAKSRRKPKDISDLELLLAIRNMLINPARWTQGHMEYQGRVCLVGAGIIASFGCLDYMTASIKNTRNRLNDLLLPTIHEQAPLRFCNVEAFNDWMYTTHADLMNVLDKKIIQLEEQA